MNAMRRSPFIFALVSAGLALAASVAAQREPTVQKDLRERFGEWAERFPAEMPSYTALEIIEQVRWDKKGQQSDPIQARFQYTFRRVGEKLEYSEARTAAGEEATASDGAGRKLVSTNRLGGAFGNHPHDLFEKLPLLVTRMATRYHEMMRYFFVPDETDTPNNFVIIGYRQIAGNGLMEVDRKPVFPSGRSWIDPEDGRLIRIEEEFGNKDTRYTIAIDNGAAEKSWLPEKITVRLFEKGRLIAQNTHTYSEIRKLSP